MNTSPTLGSLIRQRRIELGLTQQELADRISTDEIYIRASEISRIEHDRVGLPRRARLERISAALELSLAELLISSGWARRESTTPAPGARDSDGDSAPGLGLPRRFPRSDTLTTHWKRGRHAGARQ
jgi:transcriptional regulator with XRE-family HTH domain